MKFPFILDIVGALIFVALNPTLPVIFLELAIRDCAEQKTVYISG